MSNSTIIGMLNTTPDSFKVSEIDNTLKSWFDVQLDKHALKAKTDNPIWQSFNSIKDISLSEFWETWLAYQKKQNIIFFKLLAPIRETSALVNILIKFFLEKEEQDKKKLLQILLVFLLAQESLNQRDKILFDLIKATLTLLDDQSHKEANHLRNISLLRLLNMALLDTILIIHSKRLDWIFSEKSIAQTILDTFYFIDKTELKSKFDEMGNISGYLGVILPILRVILNLSVSMNNEEQDFEQGIEIIIQVMWAVINGVSFFFLQGDKSAGNNLTYADVANILTLVGLLFELMHLAFTIQEASEKYKNTPEGLEKNQLYTNYLLLIKDYIALNIQIIGIVLLTVAAMTGPAAPALIASGTIIIIVVQVLDIIVKHLLNIMKHYNDLEIAAGDAKKIQKINEQIIISCFLLAKDLLMVVIKNLLNLITFATLPVPAIIVINVIEDFLSQLIHKIIVETFDDEVEKDLLENTDDSSSLEGGTIISP